MEMELDMFFVDGVLLMALMALGASIGHYFGELARTRFPGILRLAARFDPASRDRGDFYCFFRKGVLYGK